MQLSNAIKIKDLRIRMGYTQKELASLLGNSSLSVSYWETGMRNPSVSVSLKLISIAREKGIMIDLDYLRGNEGLTINGSPNIG